MAVTVNDGVFPSSNDTRPGLYVRFVERALATVSVGSRSKVATLKTVFDGTAVTDKVYRVTGMEEAEALFGAGNVEDIKWLFRGGASEVVVATIEEDGTDPTATDWTPALNRLETYEFHVFVEPPVADGSVTDAIVTWKGTAEAEGLNYIVVYADSVTEGDVAAIKTAATDVQDETAVFVGGGVVDKDDTQIPAEMYATYVAGLIAGTPLDGSLTFKEVPFAETITRFRNSEVKELLDAGILVTAMDGETARIEQGLTLGTGQFRKIRTVKAKQAMIDDINKGVKENYIGKITNSPDGQIAVTNAVKTYLETLANNNVIAADYQVILDAEASKGDEMFVNIQVKFLDSIEYVFLTITV